MLVLTVIQGPDKGRKFELPDAEPQLVGRSSEALPLADNTVSRRHAELTPDGGMWYIRDLGSQNGTFVNGQKIGGRTQLRAGDQIRTGATLFVFGRSRERSDLDTVRLVPASQMDSAVQRAIASNEDSVLLSDDDPAQHAGDHLRILYRITALTARAPDQEELLKAVMGVVFEEFRPERGVIALIDSGDLSTMQPAVVRHAESESPEQAAGTAQPGKPAQPGNSGQPGNPEQPGQSRQIHVSRTIVQHVVAKGEGVLCSNAMTDPRFKGTDNSLGDSIARLNIRSAICAPIRARDRTFGVLYIDCSSAHRTFTSEQLALLNAIGQHAGLAMANAELYAQKLQGERLAAMGETVASLSHSIKNILQGLRSGADVVELGLKKGDLQVSTGGWGILKRNLDRIMSLTMNMLAYSRPRTLEVELTRVNALLDDCAALIRDKCSSRGVGLIIDAEADMPPVPLDSGQMHQAIMNLLTNAVEAVEPNTGVVTVKAGFRPAGTKLRDGSRSSVGELNIRVQDNGPGVPAEMHKRVFEPFFSTKGLRGTGLGLAVTKRIVELHAGRIELLSHPDRGATFTVVLPIDPAHMDPSATAQSNKPQHEARRFM
jgi:signal transduction histidine kinase/pSer/pThr/pTyr-binding forkhead associated (FHA) protein